MPTAWRHVHSGLVLLPAREGLAFWVLGHGEYRAGFGVGLLDMYQTLCQTINKYYLWKKNLGGRGCIRLKVAFSPFFFNK